LRTKSESGTTIGGAAQMRAEAIISPPPCSATLRADPERV